MNKYYHAYNFGTDLYACEHVFEEVLITKSNAEFNMTKYTPSPPKVVKQASLVILEATEPY